MPTKIKRDNNIMNRKRYSDLAKKISIFGVKESVGKNDHFL